MRKILSSNILSMRLFIPFLLSAMLMFAVMMSCAGNNEFRSREIVVLDSLISRHDDLEKAKLRHIADLRHKQSTALSEVDAYLANAMLFDEFVTYNSDSALKYADLNIGIAISTGNKEWEDRKSVV